MLSIRQAALWPRSLRLACAALVAVMAMLLAGIAALPSLFERLQAAQLQQAQARGAHVQSRALAAQLPPVRARQRQAASALAELERQLVTAQDMAELLAAINQAGLARGLQFDLFRPGEPAPHGQYIAMPVSLRLRGGYHAIGAFAADLARLPRIVTLQSLSLVQGKQGAPVMEAVLQAYRLPDAAEVAAQQASLNIIGNKPGNKQGNKQGDKQGDKQGGKPPAVAPVRWQSAPVLPPFAALAYDVVQLPDPFGAALAPVSAGSGVAGPDVRRVREPLESVAVASLAMVGSVRHGGALEALLQAGPRVIRVAVGQYLGPDHGKVTAIDEQALQYRELLQEPGGAWRERYASLPLQLAGAARAAAAEPEK